MTFNGGKVIANDGQSFAIVNGWNYINPGEQKATMTINNIEMKAGPNGFKKLRWWHSDNERWHITLYRLLGIVQ